MVCTIFVVSVHADGWAVQHSNDSKYSLELCCIYRNTSRYPICENRSVNCLKKVIISYEGTKSI